MVRERVADSLATEAIMLHTVIATAIGGGKGLEKFLRDLQDGA